MTTGHIAWLGAFARRACRCVVVAVEMELRTQATPKCRSPVDGSLTVPLMWSLNWALELLFQKAVENLSVGPGRAS